MENVISSTSSKALPRWRDLVMPKEHGSWSLALEPVALGLLAAPSLGGAALAVSVVAAFFARRPLRTGLLESQPEKRRAARGAAVGCGTIALVGWFGAIYSAGPGWWPWLVPTAIAGAFFLHFDLQLSGRDQSAEIAGATAFAWLPAVFAILAGWKAPAAAALGAVMLARAVPTVLTVRTWLRGRKTGVSRPFVPLVLVVAAVVGGAMLARAGLSPWPPVIFLALFAARSFVLLVSPRPAVRASTMGMIEAGLGILFVLATAVAWRT